MQTVPLKYKQIILFAIMLLYAVYAHAAGNSVPANSQLEQLLISNPDSALKMADSLLKQATTNNDVASMIYAGRIKAEALTANGRYMEAVTLLKNCKELLSKKEPNPTMQSAKLLADMAKALACMDQIVDASAYYFSALPIFEQHATHIEMAHLYIDLAEFYRIRNSDTINHQLYLHKAYKEVVIANDPEVYCRYYNRLAALKTVEGKYDSSVYYSKIAIKYAKQAGDINNEAWSLNEIGYVLWNQNYKRVSPEFLEAAQLFRQIGNKQGESQTFINQAHADMNQKNFARAKMLLDSCKRMLGPATTLYDQEARLYYEYYAYYNFLRNTDSALYYFEIHSELKLKQHARYFDDKIAYQESKFDNVAKQKIINEREQQLALEQKSASLRTIQRNVAIGAIATLVLVLAGLWVGFRRVRKGNVELQRLSNEVNQANEKLSTSLQQKEVLLSEIHHRVKNNLQVVISLLELESEKTGETIAGVETITRVRSMGLVHEMLYQQHDVTDLSMQLYAEQLYEVISSFQGKGKVAQANIQCHGVSMHLDQAIPLGLMLNELFTNSWKHAANNVQQLTIHLTLLCESDFCKLYYSDNGPGLLTNIDIENTNSIGLYLLKSMAKQLNGTLEYDWNEKHFLLIFPLTNGAEEDTNSGG